MKTQEFNVPAVSCQHCINAINEEVGGVAGVSTVDVNLDTKKVTVQAAESVSREQLVAAIEEAGYDVSPFNETISLN